MKRQIRHQMQSALAAIGPQAQEAKSKLACEALVRLEEFTRARTVMIYLDIPHEVHTAEVAQSAWQDGKTVLVPKVDWKQRRMTAAAIRSLEAGVEQTPSGLREPTDCEPWPAETIDLVVVPALAFDRQGNRLGRGGGYYDRFLACPGMRATRCGLAFAEQLVDELPTSDHDVPMDLIVTDADVLRFPGRTATPIQSPAVADSMETQKWQETDMDIDATAECPGD